MGVFVDHDTVFKSAVTVLGAVVRGGGGPEVHPHSRGGKSTSIRRCTEVGIVIIPAVLNVHDYCIPASTSGAGIHRLKVARCWGETKDREEVVVDVVEVKCLGDGGINIGLWIGVVGESIGASGGVGKGKGRTAVRTMVEEVVGACVPVFLGNGVVAASCGVF